MEQEKESKAKPSSKKSSHVRFTDKELRQLEKDAQMRGMSVPALLKEAYFNGRPTAVILSQEDKGQVMTELQRQGNNLNQIARRANAGISAGIEQEIAAIRRVLTGLMALISGRAAGARS